MSRTFLDKKNNVLVSVYETKEIVANPTLAGGEEELTGLQVGNKKYAAPQGTPVVANPTLEGDEETLEGLEVGKTKNKVGGEGGSKVTANPELTGDEQALQGLEVEGTKYKVDRPIKMYNHNIYIRYIGVVAFEVCLTIPLTKQDKLTVKEFKQYLATVNLNISATGHYSDERDTASVNRFIISNIKGGSNFYSISGSLETVSANDKPVYVTTTQSITPYLNSSLLTYIDSVVEA